MKLKINGEAREIPEVQSLKEALEILGCAGQHVAVAINMTCVPKSRYSETKLSEGDEIEILKPMQGG